MSMVTEKVHTAEGLISEGPGASSRENITVLSGQVLDALDVIGRVNRGIGGMTIPTVVGTGNGTMSALFAGPAIQSGSYVVTCTALVTNGGTFSVTGPTGVGLLGTATVGTAFVSAHVCFTLVDGSTDFAVGDAFTIVIAAGTSATVVGTGNGTLTALSLGPDARTGRYLVKVTGAVTNGGVVEIIGPDGTVVLADSITAGAGGTLVFTGRQINGTVTDGSTDFIKGDFFEVVVFAIAAAKVVEWDPAPTAYDGRHIVAGYMYGAVDATSADATGAIIARGPGEVQSALLGWKSGLTAGQKVLGRAGLQTLGIQVR